LLGTVAGTALSYLLWIFAGKFWMLLLARGLGGMMAGNISVSSAAIADITTPEKRSRGLALVGMAFGLGFIVGPALGAWFSIYDLTQKFPGGVVFGLNPFSACALAAFAMSMVNYFWVLLRFPETLPPEKRAAAIKAEPSVTPLQSIFHTNRPAIRRANLVNLYYTIAFSGMEFTLTFLATERFGYKSLDMMKIFLFMGFMLVVVIGAGRKMVPRWGEKRSAIIGLAFGVVGFLTLAFAPIAESLRFIFYFGLFIFSISAGLTSICLPSLVSLYTDATSQGHQIGTARAAQALGRAIGPLFFAVIYFWAGSKMSYTAGAIALLVPIWMSYKLPLTRKDTAPATAS
jgi:MFS family permease